MNSKLRWFSIVASFIFASVLVAQDFGVNPWVGVDRQSAVPVYQQPVPPPVYAGSPSGFYPLPPRTTSYRVERDPRYFSAMSPVGPAAYRVPNSQYGWNRVRPAEYYRPDYGRCGACAPAVPQNYRPIPNGAGYGYLPRSATLPRGYYRGDGLFGKDTVFAKDQPVRNIFRYLLP